MKRLWEIRLVDGSFILVEIEPTRNLADELGRLASRRWTRRWRVTPEILIRITDIVIVLPWVSPVERSRLQVKHNPNHPQKRLR